jgi:hypothetical protein
MAAENRPWGQKRIQAELARLGFQVSARTVAKYMRGCGPPGPNRHMAAVPDAACIEHVGLQLFLRPNGPVPDASRLLRHPAREHGGSPHYSDTASDSALGRAANRGMLRLGSSATAILDSRSRRPLVESPILQTGLTEPRDSAIASNEASRTTFRDTNPEFR